MFCSKEILNLHLQKGWLKCTFKLWYTEFFWHVFRTNSAKGMILLISKCCNLLSIWEVKYFLFACWRIQKSLTVCYHYIGVATFDSLKKLIHFDLTNISYYLCWCKNKIVLYQCSKTPTLAKWQYEKWQNSDDVIIIFQRPLVNIIIYQSRIDWMCLSKCRTCITFICTFCHISIMHNQRTSFSAELL